MESQKNKVAIVTGASRGIGRAIAERLGQQGAFVIVNYAGNKEKAQDVVRAIEAGGSAKAVAIQADMSRLADIHRLFEETVSIFGKLDILVNNAGLSIMKPLVDITEEEFDRLFAINARGVFFAMQEAVKRMSDNGRIVSITTGGTVMGAPGATAYSGSKAAIEGFSISLAKEVGQRGITVNTVIPGATDTDMFASVAPPEMKQMIAQMSPFGRIGQPGDVADVVMFVVSEEARWLTGQSIRATGGAV
ncbi:putative dehydrogenase/reductase (plasmid) [Scytonema sp. HK-05]|uniref:SDR family oxidoreductase n=1 Tax=Scytonema sp. HK-05 TaxID=1137095 RepID=UPI000937A62F|nr:SDR family oxidoreductase [Scytonema sp. HK-05]OKH54367.1 3-ketoacyl-ACP reductase [Scytonema sp. HK-05]BAY50454.1 putative dehydrogenase/reductase [Scytonema sp. HK-05]